MADDLTISALKQALSELEKLTTFHDKDLLVRPKLVGWSIPGWWLDEYVRQEAMAAHHRARLNRIRKRRRSVCHG